MYFWVLKTLGTFCDTQREGLPNNDTERQTAKKLTAKQLNSACRNVNLDRKETPDFLCMWAAGNRIHTAPAFISIDAHS